MKLDIFFFFNITLYAWLSENKSIYMQDNTGKLLS